MAAAVEVGETAFKIAVAALLGYCSYSDGVEAYHIATGRHEEKSWTWKRVNAFFLSFSRSLGSACGTLDWARVCGWVSLGSFAPIVTFIGYPCLFAVAMGELVKECMEIYELETKIREAPQTVLNPTQRRVALGIALVARVGSVAFPILAGAGFVLSSPPLSALAFALMFGAFFLLGASWGVTWWTDQEEKEVAKRGARQ